jgi:hypothetical protein
MWDSSTLKTYMFLTSQDLYQVCVTQEERSGVVRGSAPLRNVGCAARKKSCEGGLGGRGRKWSRINCRNTPSEHRVGEFTATRFVNAGLGTNAIRFREGTFEVETCFNRSLLQVVNCVSKHT